MFHIFTVSVLNVSNFLVILISSAYIFRGPQQHPKECCDCSCHTPGGTIELSFSFPGGRGEGGRQGRGKRNGERVMQLWEFEPRSQRRASCYLRMLGGHLVPFPGSESWLSLSLRWTVMTEAEGVWSSTIECVLSTHGALDPILNKSHRVK